jgi:hypothetical protein
MVTYIYPLFGIFWTMVIFFVWIMWLMLVFRVFADIFRSQDLGGFAKALWFIFVILTPFLGVFVYLIARGGATSQRARADYIRNSSDPASAAAEIDKLARLTAQGALTDAEFEAQKAKFLA